MIAVILFILAFICFVVIYSIHFYPNQIMDKNIVYLDVETPNTKETDYHNDCLHPCIRQFDDDIFVMVQSPWYNFNDSIENPIFYNSKNPLKWINGIVIEKTHPYGYNSDPNVFVEDGKIYVFWREFKTPYCNSINATTVTLGCMSMDGVNFSSPKPYLINQDNDFDIDVEMCPILMKRHNKYIFYAVWYEFKPQKHNKGIAIWEGSSLDKPDFILKKLVPIKPIYTVDKWHQYPFHNKLYFFPFPLRYDLWHFDLFEYKQILYMVSCADKWDNIMLSVSYDWIHFSTFQKPLVNAHYMENYVGYRQHYYKPTAYVKEDVLYLYFTANDKSDYRKNNLLLLRKDFREILKNI